MTQPSLNTTFDTSLVDLSQDRTSKMLDQYSSFSTTESAPSEDAKQPFAEPPTPTPLPTTSPAFTQASQSNSKIPTRYIPTVDAYNTWASVYDTDGNMLQSIDDHELQTLLPQFVSLASASMDPPGPYSVLDLGCGTGRNTLKLIQAPFSHLTTALQVVGIDASPAMLSLASSKIGKYLSDHPLLKQNRGAEFLVHDFLDPVRPGGPPVLLPERSEFHALISTLVLEHFPLVPFFAALSSLLGRGGLALVTNMHSDMGSRSQAGFVGKDEEGNAIKVRGTSWVHGVQETVDAAREAGFEVVDGVRECGVTEEMVERGVVGERGRKWIGVKVWYGFILRKTS